MDLYRELDQLRVSLQQAENIQSELDRRVFYMKTLYDVSKDIFSSVDTENILKQFLMMTMGNFGVMEGFLLTMNPDSRQIKHFISMGLDDAHSQKLCNWTTDLLDAADHKELSRRGVIHIPSEPLCISVTCALPFSVGENCCGLLGLGPKLTGENYSEDDVELLVTLSNNLAVALKNARSFEEIRCLNENLRSKNIQLEDALEELRAALRKVEILESVKANLSKFVPTTVCRLIDQSPDEDILSGKDQDVSILFLDVEGYTKICERLGGAELNEVIEKYFSVFMDAIYENNGDVNETAGDGLMVIFHNEDKKTNALEAVRAALSIKERATSIRQSSTTLFPPLVINMGINSGSALVGAVKFDSYTGSRWTYTAMGTTTNIAARIGALATGGSILLSKTTADRVRDNFPLTPRGMFRLKNVSEDLEVFQV